MELDTNDWYSKDASDNPAVINMDGFDNNEGVNSGATTMMHHQRQLGTASDDGNNEENKLNLSEGLKQNVTSFMWQAGKAQAQQLTSYAKIDILRPYFNVEPHQVGQRLLYSLVPKFPGTAPQKLPSELYGPTMLVFTLVALLLFQMKMSGHHVGEGTLMGSAIGLCFAYWIGGSALIWSVAYVSNSHIRGMQVASLLGYALTGHCIVLFLGTVIHTSHTHMLFYLLWAIFGGLCTLKMVTVLLERISGKTQRIVMAAIVVSLHLLFLLYLHFAYHRVVEDISDLLKDTGNYGNMKNAAAGLHSVPLVDTVTQKSVMAKIRIGKLRNDTVVPLPAAAAAAAGARHH
ncbi:protein YIPF3-like isoform X2 [Tubulanus polymorphus]|uniref:protein YIPF3-like isoform X2 n=1 Tax=Tubulanus polymorphus TaxID=672921 RepID=UPI003DA3B526